MFAIGLWPEEPLDDATVDTYSYQNYVCCKEYQLLCFHCNKGRASLHAVSFIFNILNRYKVKIFFKKRRCTVKKIATAIMAVAIGEGCETALFVLVLLGLDLDSVNCAKKSIFKCVTCL